MSKEEFEEILTMAKDLLWENSNADLRGKWLVIAQGNIEYLKTHKPDDDASE